MIDCGYSIPSLDFRAGIRLGVRMLMAIACVTFACVSPTALPAPERAMQVGVGSHESGDAALLRSLGSITRITHYAGDDSAPFAARLHELQAVGLQVIVVKHSFDRDTVAEVAALARAHPGIILQVGNEWQDTMTGAQYANLMQRIVAAAPNARFVSMGLGSVNDFTREYHAAHGPTLDAIAVHVYGLRLAASVHARVSAIRAQTSLPIVITEMGVDSAAIQDAWPRRWTREQLDSLQAREIVAGITAAQQLGVYAVVLYQLRANGDVGFSFLRRDGSERPVAQRVREWK